MKTLIAPDNYDRNICVELKTSMLKTFRVVHEEKNESKEVLLECKVVCVHAILDRRPYFYLKH